MTNIKSIIFDLDGTLVDTSRDISAAINHVRKNYGLMELAVHEVIGCVGSGVTKLIEMAVLPDSDVDPDILRTELLSYYGDHILEESVPYPGITSLLEELAGNYRLAVATNKPLALTLKIIKGLGLEKVFSTIAAPETTGKGKPDPGMLEHISEKLQIGPTETIMIGDSPVDINAARNFGCTACAVSWGYNLPEILHETKPDFMIHSPIDLLDYL